MVQSVSSSNPHSNNTTSSMISPPIFSPSHKVKSGGNTHLFNNKHSFKNSSHSQYHGKITKQHKTTASFRNHPVAQALSQRSLMEFDQQSDSSMPKPVPFTTRKKQQNASMLSCIRENTCSTSTSCEKVKSTTTTLKNSSMLSVMQQLTFHSMNPKSNTTGTNNTPVSHPNNSQISSTQPSHLPQPSTTAKYNLKASFHQVNIKAPSRSSPKRDQNYQIFHFKLHNRSSGSTSSSSNSSGCEAGSATQQACLTTSERMPMRHMTTPLLTPISSSSHTMTNPPTIPHHHHQPASCSSSVSNTPSVGTFSSQQSGTSHHHHQDEEEEPLFIILSPFRENSSESPLTLKIPSIKYLERTIFSEPISKKYCAASTSSFSSPTTTRNEMEKIFKNYISEKELLTSHLNLNSTLSKNI
ncbi:hypothetical protein C9374_002117 [Naegleria lovaniensis]|uniref:Uncharacterized protein n=1 Tax=Naegleria lovaniensis TaxID=51637 RepID=A0AA88GQN4_NAELO|nr:uncharacterized protein C9374_002117 [Naegleria lovaniensis]KAG2387082.1 hypothetical protein C9374_002117 [Naegleria lovaniensis]